MDTRGYENIKIRFDVQSNTANNFDLIYSVDGGLTFVLVQNNISLTTGGGFSPVQLNLSGFGEIEDQPYVIFRFFTTSSGSTTWNSPGM